MGWVMLAAALLAVAAGLVAAAAGTARLQRRGVQLAVGVIATAAVNSALVLGVHTVPVQLLTLGTGVTLLVAVHRWAAALRVVGRRDQARDRHRAEGHDDTKRR